MSEGISLLNWVTHVFDHPVTSPAWYWSLDAPEWQGNPNAPEWPGNPEHTAFLIAETFERSGELLSRFSDAQLDQAFWFLVGESGSGLMRVLVDLGVPLSTRLRALRSFVPLFEQVMVLRCSPHLSHLDEQPANPLNSACYMWWDILPICGEPNDPERIDFDEAVLQVLRQLLEIPHDACRESALHGVSEWQFYYPNIRSIVDEFLLSTPNLRPELISYAQRAKVGDVQ